MQILNPVMLTMAVAFLGILCTPSAYLPVAAGAAVGAPWISRLAGSAFDNFVIRPPGPEEAPVSAKALSDELARLIIKVVPLFLFLSRDLICFSLFVYTKKGRQEEKT